MDPSPSLDTATSGHERGAVRDSRWTVPDLIDFDYYVDEDERLLRETPAVRRRLAERDRSLYLGRIKPVVGSVPEHTRRHRSATLRLWLEARRRNEDERVRELLPGASFARGQRLVTLGVSVAGLALGVGLASALLNYEGQHPVNVAWFVTILVLLQVVLAGLTASVWLLRGSAPMRSVLQDFSFLSHVIQPLVSRASRWVQRSRLGHLPQEARDQALARKGLLESHRALYGSASYLPMLIPAQMFGVAFNVGAIMTTISLEWFTDLAFGWGSALDVAPQTIYEIARVIALPWSPLFGEGVGYPSLEQVAGSRINLKDPLFILQAEDLRSWRWFLVLAVATYGLLPRLLLLGGSLIAQRWALAKLPFTHARTQGLYARLVTPSLEVAASASGSGPEMAIPEATSETTPTPAQGAAAVPSATPGGIAVDACLLMIHTDIEGLLLDEDRRRLERMLREHTGWRVAATCTYGESRGLATQAVSTVEEAGWQDPPPRVALVQDGTQPPITESLRFLRTLRGVVGGQGQIVLALIGDPTPADRLPPLSDFDFKDWQRKIDQMGDPYLRLEMLAPANEGKA